MTTLHTATPNSPLELRDRLAMERTRLANERTLLAYLRTGMALVIAGFSLINFFRDNVYVWAGVLFVPMGLVIVVVGWLRYRVRARHIEQYVAAADAMA
ncbi:hypothetical protein CDA63_08220 [Hymenobacter amundsenii]|uniref:DUF202 domain-containing protein n=1 Tax=Hymenobacter amundsenii TaxID=2006685 RepID=A0A246FLJ0_9BACT|nr:DUF202 domain-containing protein [Hymenobacter amundsenii]OWP63559.1 hypothetical protein CDA63_08220 [Hymenobacter amundsenii]